MKLENLKDGYLSGKSKLILRNTYFTQHLQTSGKCRVCQSPFFELGTNEFQSGPILFLLFIYQCLRINVGSDVLYFNIFFPVYSGLPG